MVYAASFTVAELELLRGIIDAVLLLDEDDSSDELYVGSSLVDSVAEVSTPFCPRRSSLRISSRRFAGLYDVRSNC